MTVPRPFRTLDLIKVCHPAECRSHTDCNSPGKRPVDSATQSAIEPLRDIERWMDYGGNYGVVCLDSNEMVVWDIDSAEFRNVLDETLPDTLTVESGGSGVGEHRYFRCRDFSINSSWSNPEGSVRSRNWHAVGPNSIHPDTGSEYRILHDREIATVTVDDLGAAMSELSSREDGGGGGAGGSSGGGGGGLHGTKKAEDLDTEPTTETLRSLKFINSESRRQEIAKVLDHRHPPRHIRVWAGGFLHSVCGLTQSQLEELLRKQADWATNGNRIRTEVRSLVQESISNPRAEESVNLDQYLSLPDDSGERGTPDEGKPRSGLSMSEGATFEEKESVVELNGDGGAVQARLMQGTTEDGERFEYVDVATGNVEETETVNGETVRVPNIDDGPGEADSIGSPDSLEAKITALEKLKEKINE
jgi:hypothetical protein